MSFSMSVNKYLKKHQLIKNNVWIVFIFQIKFAGVIRVNSLLNTECPLPPLSNMCYGWMDGRMDELKVETVYNVHCTLHIVHTVQCTAVNIQPTASHGMNAN